MLHGFMGWNLSIFYLPTALLILPITILWLKNIFPAYPEIYLHSNTSINLITNKIRFAKEFVKFNERCFVRLLGDMRSYNFVVDITPDIEDFQYRIRAIDFDQQSYEGRKNLYLPQYFKENNILVNLALQCLNKDSIEQYQSEERTMMAFRVANSRYQAHGIV